MFTGQNAPGFTAEINSEETQVWWSGRGDQSMVATQKVSILADETDAGNTPTSTLRGGNILGVEYADSDNAYIYDEDGTGGKQTAAGILEHTMNMLVDNTSTKRFTQMMVLGLLHRTDIVGLDAQAEAQLIRRGFRFDDNENTGAGFLVHPKGRVMWGGNHTVTAAENGLLLIGTAALTFQLPTIAVGLLYEFLQSADANMVINGTSNILADGNATADTLTFSTGSHKIGSFVRIRAVYISTTLKWIVENVGGTTMTVA